MPFPGVRMKELSLDRARNVALVLIEMDAGSRIPDHDHVFPDEALVLTGDVTSGGRELHAGDFFHAGAGTHHTNVVSRNGCTGLLSLAATVWVDLRARSQPVA